MRKIFFFILLIGCIFMLVLLVPRFIKIRQVSCHSQFGPCSGYLSKLVGQAESKSLNEAKGYLKSLLLDEAQVVDFSLRFALPNRLQVDIVERKAMVGLRQVGINGFALIDKTGRIIDFQEKTLLPVLMFEKGIDNFEVGKKVSLKVRFAGELLSRLSNPYQVKQALIRDECLEIELNQGLKVVFPLEGDVDVLLGSLQLVLSRLNTEAEDFKIGEEQIRPRLIDLRFKNPVIK